MKAMLVRRYGEPDVFELGEFVMPRPDGGAVLVRVRGSSVNLTGAPAQGSPAGGPTSSLTTAPWP